MARFVPDVKTQRWVIIAPSRKQRPEEIQKLCVFCYGNESETPPEVYRIGEGEANKPGWKVRVVPNKFPITDIHEVIIHSPDDTADFETLDLPQIELIFQTYRERYQTHRQEGHVLIFCNHGESAGASLAHPHSQLVVVPHQITIDILEKEPIKNLIEENKFFTVYCPDFSQWPYEVWIAPKDPPEGGQASQKDKTFGDSSDEELTHLVSLVQRSLKRLIAKYNDPNTYKLHRNEPFSYNFYIYHGANWYLRIIPRLIHRAGFELGTGLNVNVMDPIDASEELKKISV